MRLVKIFVVAVVVLAATSCGNNAADGADGIAPRGKMNIKMTQGMVDSVSYLFGVNSAWMALAQGFCDDISELNMDELIKGFEDCMAAGQPKPSSKPYMFEPDTVWAKTFKVNPYDMNDIFNSYLQKRYAQIADQVKAEGEAYLAEVAKMEGVSTTESGLSYVINSEGEGDNVVTGDTAVVNYKGTLMDGTQFDANDSTAFVTASGRLIAGFAEGLTLLNKGARATFYIPGDLAYGMLPPQGSPIRPNELLIFEVEVLDILKPNGD